MTTTDPAAAADFPTVWTEPGDTELTWDRDDMHMPFAVAPLTEDYVAIMTEGMAYNVRKMDVPYDILSRVWNGYVYFAGRPKVPASDEKAALAAYTERKRAAISTAREYWDGTAMPAVRALERWFASTDVEALSPTELAEAWDVARAHAERTWQTHFYAIRGPYQITDDLTDAYERAVPEASPGEALRLIQGRADVLHEVEAGLDRLAEAVAGEPELRDAIHAGNHTVRSLGSMRGGRAFVAGLQAFLDQHGHLGGSFDDLAFPSWGEDPSIVVGDIGRRLASDIGSAEARRARLLTESDALADRVRARLRDRPDALAEFERLLAAGRDVGPLTEVHNYWIDRLVQARVRRFVLRVGARLTHLGVIATAEDILYLRWAEVPGRLRHPSPADDLVEERRAEHRRQGGLKAPMQVGHVPDAPPEADRFDGARYAATDATHLRGTGASAGVVRGIARVVLGPHDFDKVEPGDLIVAPSSNPSWVPLFAIAGGLLTNTGGVLCHAAVVAREFGLPAVVGLGDATVRIADGATVELDGSTGLVRIL
jgi:phosphohistidine swiveling domain-containing protein